MFRRRGCFTPLAGSQYCAGLLTIRADGHSVSSTVDIVRHAGYRCTAARQDGGHGAHDSHSRLHLGIIASSVRNVVSNPIGVFVIKVQSLFDEHNADNSNADGLLFETF